MDEKMKALANDILEKCHQQELTYSQMWILLTALQTRCDDSLSSLRKQTESSTVAKLKYF